MEFRFSPELIDYPIAIEAMEGRVKGIHQKKDSELIWGLEHPPLYTAGTSALESDLRSPLFPVYPSQRGGKHTYHGPGQLVVYTLIDLASRESKDVRKFVSTLEEWCIQTLNTYGIEAMQREGRIGLWINTPQGEQKIAAIGVRISQWVTWHGLAINVNPNLDHFQGIVPCGISNFGVTSLHKLGVETSTEEFFNSLKKNCPFL
jgi:lipoyl(octanoyl) transferase